MKAKGWTRKQELRKGRCQSPLLANIYLDPLDHLMAKGDRDGALCGRLRHYVPERSRSEAGPGAGASNGLRKHGLTLHPDKTRDSGCRRSRRL